MFSAAQVFGLTGGWLLGTLIIGSIRCYVNESYVPVFFGRVAETGGLLGLFIVYYYWKVAT